MQVLNGPEVKAKMGGKKWARESSALDRFVSLDLLIFVLLTHLILFCEARFHRTLATDELRAWYGETHVSRAAERGAIGTLLVSDGLFRCVLQTLSPLLLSTIERLNPRLAGVHQKPRSAPAEAVRRTDGTGEAIRGRGAGILEHA